MPIISAPSAVLPELLAKDFPGQRFASSLHHIEQHLAHLSSDGGCKRYGGSHRELQLLGTKKEKQPTDAGNAACAIIHDTWS
jgi:hypothetical protein